MPINKSKFIVPSVEVFEIPEEFTQALFHLFLFIFLSILYFTIYQGLCVLLEHSQT